MKRLLILACLTLVSCTQTNTKTVNVDCGGYTMDGVYIADVKVTTDYYDVDKGTIKDVARTTEQTFTSRVVFYSYQCASTFLDVGFHNGFESLVVDTKFNRPFDRGYNYNTKIHIMGACNTDDCEVIAAFTDEAVGESVVHVERTWKLTDLDKWEDSPYAVAAELDHIPFGLLDFPMEELDVEGVYE